MNPSLLNDVKITMVAALATAGTTSIGGTILDMSGWEGVLFIAKLGDATTSSVITLQAQEHTANAASGMTTLTGLSAAYTAAVSDADDNLLVIDLYRPRERYVRPLLTRTTQNCVIAGIIAIQYGATKKPTTQDASVLASATGVEPSE